MAVVLDIHRNRTYLGRAIAVFYYITFLPVESLTRFRPYGSKRLLRPRIGPQNHLLFLCLVDAADVVPTQDMIPVHAAHLYIAI